MGKKQIPNHWYSTRSKIPKIEEQSERQEPSCIAFTKPMAESPSALNRLSFRNEYASPLSNRPQILSQNDNEIEWDLTSPSARKYQVMLSDKKTSTPNRTPTRKRELRPRSVLCKKNIALAVTEENCKIDFENELEALNDLVNSEQAQMITPPHSSQEDEECQDVLSKPPMSGDLNTSDVFTDDSFFSDSILLNTQALEVEACNKDHPRDADEVSVQPRKWQSLCRRSFELDSETDSFSETNNFTKPFSRVESISKKTLVSHDKSNFSKKIEQHHHSSDLLPSAPVSSSITHSVTQTGNSIVAKSPAQSFTSNFIHSQCSQPNRRPVMSSTPKPPQYVPLPKPASALVTRNYQTNSNHTKQVELMENKKLPVNTKKQESWPQELKKPVINSSSADLFGDDDEDDDLLCAIAEEVESKYVSTTNCSTNLVDDDDDDGFFQPEVLAFISQIESQAISTQKTTAEIVEEKRQAALLKRKQRSMSKR